MASDVGHVDARPISVGRRLIHRVWAILAAALVILILAAMGALMLSAAPLWLWAATPAEGIGSEVKTKQPAWLHPLNAR